ncbi:hypothetical protein [Furfurilactobacillus entadae]|uniref:hypothetical protein n=1 Tax=Furfurilactobacillus entadae TaxID=2922307 RepID=UPI0035F0BBDB
MRVPSVVNVMGIKYKVRYEDVPVADGITVWGYTEFDQALIVLKRDMAKQKIAQTFIHELTHAMIHEMGDDEHSNDETIVNPLGNVIYQVMKENDIKL